MAQKPSKPEGRAVSPRFRKRTKEAKPAKRRDEWLDDVTPILQELDKQTDRGVAIIAGSFLDKLLALVIERRLLPLDDDKMPSNQRKALFGRMAPLSTFSAKIKIGFAIGLYNVVAYRQFEMIREVRNKFAHRLEALDFNHPDIAKIVNDPDRHSLIKDGCSPRSEFMLAFSVLTVMLYSEMELEDLRLPYLMQTHPNVFADAVRWAQKLQGSRSEPQPSPHQSNGDGET
jgi:DNA-binding MltR family transcriptional regulator